MADDRITTPPTSPGLTRFYEGSSSNIQLDPMTVIGACIAVMLIVIALHFIL